ncbi:MAG: hypothetical protein AAF596_04645 [Planctomycetota bacterium]
MPGKNRLRTASVELSTVPGARRLYVFFGGIASGIAMPPFEFYNAAQILDDNKVFVRDFRQAWYHAGLRGVSRDLPSTAEFLRQQVAELHAESVTFVGNSMGGFAALLFASLTGLGPAVAFAPQTFLTPALRYKHRDTRWGRKVWTAYLRTGYKPRAFDLRPIVERRRTAWPLTVYVSADDRRDLSHARHIEGLAGVQVTVLHGGGHNVVRRLRDEGRLAAILRGGDSTPAAEAA